MVTTANHIESPKFREQVYNTLLGYSDWIENNANQLADAIAGGCTDYEIRMFYETGNAAPTISVDINKTPLEVVHPMYFQSNGEPYD